VRTSFLFILFAGSIISGLSQSGNYPDLFGDDWKKAEAFEKENRSWIEPVLVKNHISYPLAISIIFPELVRYSALRDKMEITLLKTLYVNLGEDYANFSVGQFQMKPSFAEMITEKAPAVLNRRSAITFKKISDFDDVKDFRKTILKDLEDPVSQVNYLIAFIKICENKFQTARKDDSSRVRFLATAYNFGFIMKEDEIKSMIGKKFFNTRLFNGEKYSYADVSMLWYKQNISER
jgi:hypothetical protein